MISFENVTKIYREGNKPALDRVSLRVDPGEFVFLVGASGSGKSTFLRLILREERLTSGTVNVLGRDVTTLSSRDVPKIRRLIGCVFQDFRLLPDKTVFDNIALALQVIGAPRHKIHTSVAEMLDLVGLEGKADRLPNQLSGGEQQRVAIARAMVNRPKLLLADEPTGNLDPQMALGIVNIIDRINHAGTTVLMATHADNIVDSMRRRVVELQEGQIVRDDSQGVYGGGK